MHKENIIKMANCTKPERRENLERLNYLLQALKEASVEYPYSTIGNAIQQLESRIKEKRRRKLLHRIQVLRNKKKGK